MLKKVEDVQDSASTTITISEGVDCFELIMANRHLDEGVNAVVLMEEVGPFAQKHEAELAIDWASGKKFSGLLLARSD